MSRRSKKPESTASSTNRRTPRTSGKVGGAACTNSHRCCSTIEAKLLRSLRFNVQSLRLDGNNMKTQITLLALAVGSLSAFAADFTGTWKAEFNTQRGLQKYTFTLKQDGTSVTGKANVERNGEKREAEVKEGKVEGETVTFVEPLKIQDNEIQITFSKQKSAYEIKFTRKAGDFGSSE